MTLDAPVIAVANGPVGIAITPDGSTAYTANSDDTLTPIDLRTQPATASTPIPVGTLSQPDGISIDPSGTRAYAANASDSVTPVNLRASPPVPERPIAVASPSASARASTVPNASADRRK